MLLSKIRILRGTIFVLSLIIWSVTGVYIVRLSSVVDLVNFISIPSLFSYLLIFRPKFARKIVLSYLIFSVIITMLVAGYFILFSKAIPQMQISWSQLPIAVYFLLSVYSVLYLSDKFIELAVSSALTISCIKTGKFLKKAIKSSFHLAFIIFVIIPYLIAVFATHWVKFSDTLNSDILPDMEYRQVYFHAADGTRLNGWFIPSTVRISDSTVVLVPGRCPTKTLFVPHVRILNSSNYNVLLLDLRGNGNSGGNKYSFGINEAKDILASVDYLQENFSESSRYVFGFGINEGASAMIAAAAEDERFAGVAIDNPSGYEVSMPLWLTDYIPDWIQKAMLKVTKSIVYADIGQAVWGTEGLYEKISHISPCPVLVTGSLINDKSNRLQAIELYARAEEPKTLWLTPPETAEYQGPGLQQDYFRNIVKLFDFGRTKQQSGHWRINQDTGPEARYN